MAEDRNNSQKFIGQSHTTGQTRCPSPGGGASGAQRTVVSTTTPGVPVARENSPPRGPRTLLLRRGENGFGFTLRHFIVYPPESCCMLPGHERTKIDEPMDTIFVKQVRVNSPASEAGLRTGDRVVSVDGKPTRGEQYASVVQRIQQADTWLRLLVVSKEDDILQRYFGETAHNPETNQRPCLRSPERNLQRQRRSISMIPGLSPRARQSWVCPTSPCTVQSELDRTIDAGYSYRDRELSNRKDGSIVPSKNQLLHEPAGQTQVATQRKPLQEASPFLYDSLIEKNREKKQQHTNDPNSSRSCCKQLESKCDIYEKTRPESIYTRPSSEQVYDRMKDSIYEHVRLGDSVHLADDQQQQQQLTMLLHPISKAEPQVPIYRPCRRITSRRASEGSATTTLGTTAATIDPSTSLNDEDLTTYGSIGDDPESRFSVDSKRDFSPCPSTYNSTSTLAGNTNSNYDRSTNGHSFTRNGNISECSDDSIIMTRLRKSFEQKEEFLRRPSHPVGWFLPGESLDFNATATGSGNNSAVIRREFYAKPQKLQKQIWPPGQEQKQSRMEMSPTRKSEDKILSGKLTCGKPTNQSVQRVKADSAEVEYSSSRCYELDADNIGSTGNVAQLRITEEDQFQEPQNAPSTNQYYDMELSGEDHLNFGQTKCSNKSTFAGTLSRIHENITNALLSSTERHSPSLQNTRNGSSSLPSSPGPEKKVNEKPALLPHGLQIVSKRAKQFESGRLLSDEDEPAGDRTNLYKSELSRLSSKKTVPNVAIRKREFESKAGAQEPRKIPPPTKESKSLDAGIGLSGNRVIPIGSRHIHCIPQRIDDYAPAKENIDAIRIQAKSRSNSAESWDTNTTGNSPSRKSARHPWQFKRDERVDQKQQSAAQIDITEVTIPSASLEPTDLADNLTDRSLGHPEFADHIDLHEKSPKQKNYSPVNVVQSDGNNVHTSNVVFRRQKNTQIGEEDRAMRRVSYLKATWGERMHVDSDLDLSDSEPVHVPRSFRKKWKPPLFPGDITPLCRLFEDMTQATSLSRNISRDAAASGTNGTGSIGSSVGASMASRGDTDQIEREGSLHVKFTVLDGKRSSDRSWKQVWGVLRGPILTFYKDRHSQSPSLSIDGENMRQNVDIRCSSVDIAEDYTKRKNVLRLANPAAEVLLQSEDATSMALWLRALHEYAAAEKPSDLAYSSTSKQQAVPQAPGPSTVTNISTNGQRLSPVPSHKGIKKLTSFRNRSPTGQSPVNKTRKPSQPIESLASPKTKTWKGRVAKQLRRMHGQAGSPSSPSGQLPPEGATFKVPLELCPPSSFSEFVPLIVEMCTSIVEARGLEVVGIYRVPGNTAAISHLTESVNRGFENINLQDPRWSDVNVISSLLKSFFRQLPDSLLTAELYPMFIDADKVEDPQRRMTTIRKLLKDLPEHHFETLKFLMFHLKKIVEHSEVNKMEAKNLAIVFGPTLVRASGSRDNMVTMVNDMSHQCRIVESLLNNVDWFFSDDDLDDLSRLSVNLSLPADACETETTSTTNHSLLLNNIQKVEGTREMASAKDIVSSIISAANRKIQRRRKGQDETDADNHETDKNKHGKQELENLAASRKSMALTERQCSVSEIVLMHENKNQGENMSGTIVSAPSTLSVTLSPVASARLENHSVQASENESSRLSSSLDTCNRMDNVLSRAGTSKEIKSKLVVPNLPMLTMISTLPIERSSVSSAPESVRFLSETGLSCFDASSILSSGSNETKQSNDEVAIRTYAGLSATTQERIRRFEQETKAMLQRDQNRQRRESEKREEEKQRIEMEWQLAKREMENDDLLDNIVDNTVAPNCFSTARLSCADDKLKEKPLDFGNKHRSSRSISRTVAPLSITLQQEPTNLCKTGHVAGESVTSINLATDAATTLTEANKNNIKKLKTDKESIMESQNLPPVRYGSLDSLHENHDVSRSSLSPSQQCKHLPGDISDDGSDLLTSLTTTFDRKWRSLVNPSNQSRVSTDNVLLSGNEENDGNEQRREQERIKQRSDEYQGQQVIGASGSREDEINLETYRDPSLHKSLLDKNQFSRHKNDTPEKDTDSSIADHLLNQVKEYVPDNNRDAIDQSNNFLNSEENLNGNPSDGDERAQTEKLKSPEKGRLKTDIELVDQSYSNKLEKFESLTNFEVRSRLKRSESLNKRTENASSKLKRSESLNKHSAERLSSSPTNGKLKRSESLNKHSERLDSSNIKLKRSESLTKTEKTECNISKRRQSVRKDTVIKLKRKNGMPERSIKRRHTVGGTKDFDKVHWLDNKLQEAERVSVKNDYRPKKSQLRTSSPDLSANRIGVADTSFLIEVSFRGPSNVVFNVTNTARPQSLPDASLAAKVFKVPLESHV